MKSIVFVTDTWDNANGVATWLSNTKNILEQKNFRVTVIHPGDFYNVQVPNFPEIKLTFTTKNKLEEMIEKDKPDYINIVTEGSLGLAGRQACMDRGWRFTSFYHTRFPEYVYVRVGGFKETTYNYLRWFHKASSRTMVGTPSIMEDLSKERFLNLGLVPMGVDLDLFHRNEKAQLPEGIVRPVFTFLGRLAPEKNLEAFLDCNLPGSKLVIGDGPARTQLEEKYGKSAHFVGYKKGQELVDLLSASDVFVFPSKTDTFGLTMIEAMACGVPVAGYEVTGPKDVVINGENGFLGPNLEENAKKCLTLDRTTCIKSAQKYSWENSVNKFIENLVPIS